VLFLLNFNNLFNNDISTYIIILNCNTVVDSDSSEPIFKRKPSSTYTPTANLDSLNSKQQLGPQYLKINGNAFVYL